MRNLFKKLSLPVIGVIAIIGWLLILMGSCTLAFPPPAASEGQARSADNAGPGPDLKHIKEERRRFQDQELITARPFSPIFNPGDPPRIVWRDVDDVRQMGSDGRLHVRWFDTDLNEVTRPTRPGRWGASIKGTVPNGTPVRRAMTCYCRPPLFLFFLFPPDYTITLPPSTGAIVPQVWHEHQDEIARVHKDLLFKAVNDTEAGLILFAGLAGAKPLGRTPLTTESMAVVNEDYHLALKLKLQALQNTIRPLKPPRRRATPAPVLREGSLAEAGMHRSRQRGSRESARSGWRIRERRS